MRKSMGPVAAITQGLIEMIIVIVVMAGGAVAGEAVAMGAVAMEAGEAAMGAAMGAGEAAMGAAMEAVEAAMEAGEAAEVPLEAVKAVELHRVQHSQYSKMQHKLLKQVKKADVR